MDNDKDVIQRLTRVETLLEVLAIEVKEQGNNHKKALAEAVNKLELYLNSDKSTRGRLETLETIVIREIKPEMQIIKDSIGDLTMFKNRLVITGKNVKWFVLVFMGNIVMTFLYFLEKIKELL